MRALAAPVLAAMLTFASSASAVDERRIEFSAATTRKAPEFAAALRSYLGEVRPKIVLGVEAAAGSHPWQAALLVSWIADPARAVFCGASVRNERWLVTAAHCLRDLEAMDVHAVVGATALEQGARRINAKRLIVRSDYNLSSKDNDIALIELFEPLTLGADVQALATLSAQEESAAPFADSTRFEISGWGATEEGGKTVSRLREATVPFVSRAACNDVLSYDDAVTENMLCAGVAAGGSDACQGDSGGPLVARTATGERRLAGIVSWGEGCARPGKYGVYTRVSRYESWIEACVSGTAQCQ